MSDRVGLKTYEKLLVPISVDQRVIYGDCICTRMRWIVGRKEMSGAGGQMFPDRPRHEKSMERISLETSFLQKPKMSLEWQFSLWYWICSKKPEIEEKSHLLQKSRVYLYDTLFWKILLTVLILADVNFKKYKKFRDFLQFIKQHIFT